MWTNDGVDVPYIVNGGCDLGHIQSKTETDGTLGNDK